MNDYVGGSKGIEDGSTLVRPMLAGSENNSLLKILKITVTILHLIWLYHILRLLKGDISISLI